MTVTSASRIATFNGSGTTGPFTFNYRVISTSDFTVTKVAADGTRTLLADPADYSASLVSLGLSGGAVTTVATVDVGETLVVEGNADIAQGVQYRNQGRFFPKTHEQSYDLLTIIAQETRERVNRGILLPPESSLTGPLLLPDPEAGKAIVWNAAGTGITNSASTLEDVSIVAGAIANVNTVAGIASEVAVVAGDAADIATVAGDSAHIQALGALSTELGALGAITANITTVAGISSNVTTLAGISSDITTLAAISSDVTSLAAAAANINVVGNNISGVNTCAANIDDIIAAASSVANHKTDATRDPTANDDDSDTSGVGTEFSVNSIWINQSASPVEVWRCVDASTGAASWIKTSFTVDELGTMATQDATAIAVTGGTIGVGVNVRTFDVWAIREQGELTEEDDRFVIKWRRAIRLHNIDASVQTGTVTIDLKKNGTNIGGINAVAVTSTQTETAVNDSSNAYIDFAADDELSIDKSSVSSAEDLLVWLDVEER